jgi:hypothetical protein
VDWSVLGLADALIVATYLALAIDDAEQDDGVHVNESDEHAEHDEEDQTQLVLVDLALQRGAMQQHGPLDGDQNERGVVEQQDPPQQDERVIVQQARHHLEHVPRYAYYTGACQCCLIRTRGGKTDGGAEVHPEFKMI